MSDQFHSAVLAFLNEHKFQIVRKAFKFGLEPEDFEQDVALFILEHGQRHDSSRSSFAGFVFGSLEKIVKRKSVNVLRFAQSIDDGSDVSRFLRASAEEIAVQENHFELLTPNLTYKIPGGANLASLANEISGKSAMQIALERGLTKRRVNQMLAAARANAQVQYSFFGGWENE